MSQVFKETVTFEKDVTIYGDLHIHGDAIEYRKEIHIMDSIDPNVDPKLLQGILDEISETKDEIYHVKCKVDRMYSKFNFYNDE